MTRRPVLIAIIVFALAASPFVASGGAQTTTTVSREAMGVLLGGPEGLADRPFDLRVGSLPADFPADLLPNGAEIRVSAGVDGLSAVVAVLAHFSTDERIAYEQRLEGAGWTNPLRPVGFATRDVGPTLSLCRGDRFATLVFLLRSDGTSYVRASVVTEPGRACRAGTPAAPEAVPLPTMSVPAGARSGRASMGGTADAMYSSIRLATRMAAGEVGAHYARQLVAAGWAIEGEAHDDRSMSVTRLRGATPAGASMTAVLVVTAVGGADEVDVLLRLVQAQGLGSGR